MRLQKYLNEKYKTGVKSNFGDYVEIFENPSNKEFLEVAKAGDNLHSYDPKGKIVRFFADMKKKKVYIQVADVPHNATWQKFGDGRNEENDPTLLTGVAKQIGGKWVMKTSDSGAGPNLKKYTVKDWAWVDKYIEVTPLLNKIKSKKLSTQGYR